MCPASAMARMLRREGSSPFPAVRPSLLGSRGEAAPCAASPAARVGLANRLRNRRSPQEPATAWPFAPRAWGVSARPPSLAAPVPDLGLRCASRVRSLPRGGHARTHPPSRGRLGPPRPHACPGKAGGTLMLPAPDPASRSRPLCPRPAGARLARSRRPALLAPAWGFGGQRPREGGGAWPAPRNRSPIRARHAPGRASLIGNGVLNLSMRHTESRSRSCSRGEAVMARAPEG